MTDPHTRTIIVYHLATDQVVDGGTIWQDKDFNSVDRSGLCDDSLKAYNSKEVQNDEQDGDHDQSVNPAAGFREPWADVRTEKSEEP